MKILKIALISVACLILTSTLVGLSLKTETTKAGELVLDSVPEGPTIDEDYQPHGSMSITGSATIDCEPDRLTISVRLEYLDPNSADKATDEVARKIDRLLSSLQSLGISRDDVETTNYKIDQIYEWEYYENGKKKERVFKGYKVVNTIKITVKDFEKGGKVIDATSHAGGLVDSINFELSREKREQTKLKAMELAAKDAKLKAETVLSALGEELGHVTSVNLNNYGYKPYVYWDRNKVASAGIDSHNIAPPTTILPGDLTVSANINVVFDIL